MATSPATQEKVLSDDQPATWLPHPEERAVGERIDRSCKPHRSAYATSAPAWPETTAWLIQNVPLR